jgi:hypothetical protein
VLLVEAQIRYFTADEPELPEGLQADVEEAIKVGVLVRDSELVNKVGAFEDRRHLKLGQDRLYWDGRRVVGGLLVVGLLVGGLLVVGLLVGGLLVGGLLVGGLLVGGLLVGGLLVGGLLVGGLLVGGFRETRE